MTPDKIIAIVTLAIDAIEKLATGIPAIVNVVNQLRTTLAKMLADGRDPTQEEWDALNAQIDEAMAALNA